MNEGSGAICREEDPQSGDGRRDPVGGQHAQSCPCSSSLHLSSPRCCIIHTELSAGVTQSVADVPGSLAQPLLLYTCMLPHVHEGPDWPWQSQKQHGEGGFQGPTQLEKMVEIGAFETTHLLPHLPVLPYFELGKESNTA